MFGVGCTYAKHGCGKMLIFVNVKWTIALLLVVTFFLSSCGKFIPVDHAWGLTVTNKSKDTFVMVPGFEYPNMTLPDPSAGWGTPVLYPGKGIRLESKVPWRERINDLPTDTLLLFIIDIDTFHKYGYETVRSTNNVKGFKKVAAGDLSSDAGGEIFIP